MISRNLLWLAIGGVCIAAACAAPAPSVVARYAAPDGDWDYVSVDPTFGRLYVGRGDGVLAIDLKTGAVTPRFVKGRYTAAVIPLNDGRFALTTAADDDLIGFFDRLTGKVVAEIATDKGPDAATLDPATGAVYVMNGEAGTISVVDGAQRKIVRKIRVGDGLELEGAALDGKGHLFVNVANRVEIAVVDLAAGEAVGRIKLADCKDPTGIAINPKTGLGYSVCGNGQLKVIDTATRQVLTSIAVAEESDGVILDAKRERLYASSNKGMLSIISIKDGRKPRLLTNLPTKTNARTGALDPATGRVYVAGGPYDDTTDKALHFEVLAVDVGL